jgi:two-component system, OmpR family, alkaline phosphatase synthesis response regulator PhoP
MRAMESGFFPVRNANFPRFPGERRLLWVGCMSRPKILIVDDDVKISSLLHAVLVRNGYDVRTENRSFAALATARVFRPDLALLDVDMPGKDGGAVAAELASDPDLAQTPVIFVTSLVSQHEAGMHGSARFISKPVDLATLLATVEGVLPRIAA